MNLENHLRSRYVDLNLHRPVIDEENDVATFHLWNTSGKLIGYQQYRRTGLKLPGNNPKMGRYFTYRSQPTVAVWGTESLHLTPGLVFLTEGIFDAARLTQRGFSAVAALSNDPSTDVANWLWMLNRTVVAVCDNDAAGRKLAKFGNHALFTQEKDLGASSEEEVTAVLSPFTQ